MPRVSRCPGARRCRARRSSGRRRHVVPLMPRTGGARARCFWRYRLSAPPRCRHSGAHGVLRHDVPLMSRRGSGRRGTLCGRWSRHAMTRMVWHGGRARHHSRHAVPRMTRLGTGRSASDGPALSSHPLGRRGERCHALLADLDRPPLCRPPGRRRRLLPDRGRRSLDGRWAHLHVTLVLSCSGIAPGKRSKYANNCCQGCSSRHNILPRRGESCPLPQLTRPAAGPKPCVVGPEGTAVSE